MDHSEEAIVQVHRELWYLALSAFEGNNLPKYRLIEEVKRLFENHYSVEPVHGFKDERVDSSNADGIKVSRRLRGSAMESS